MMTHEPRHLDRPMFAMLAAGALTIVTPRPKLAEKMKWASS